MTVPEAVRQRRRQAGAPLRSDMNGNSHPAPPKFSLVAGGRRGKRIMSLTILLLFLLGSYQSYRFLRHLHRLLFQSYGRGLCAGVPLHDDDALDRSWRKYTSKIIAASRHPDDPEDSHGEWTRRLYGALDAGGVWGRVRVEGGVGEVAMERILGVVRRRLASPETAPALKIAVFGGSVTEGKGCDKASVSIPKGSIMGNPMYCAWPYRLEQFLNNLLGATDVVQVVNMAEEGTETALMTPLLRNRIFPPKLHPYGPDVVINAYGTSDYMSSDYETPEETIRNEMQAFLHAANSSRVACNDNEYEYDEDYNDNVPLVITMDDSSLSTISTDHHAHVMSLNYNDAISRAVKFDRDAIRSSGDDVPFGMAGHVALAWILTHAFARKVVDYCNANPFTPLPPPPATPPTASVDTTNATTTTGCATEPPCPFRFFAGPTGTVKKATDITKYLKPFITQNSGWMALSDMSTGWSRKAGLEATTRHASLTLEVSRIERPIRYVNLMIVRSNLAKFAKSVARYTVTVQGTKEGEEEREVSFEIEGFHESPVHITYPVEVDLKDYAAGVGSDVRLTVELVGGSAYKILGILMCS